MLYACHINPTELKQRHLTQTTKNKLLTINAGSKVTLDDDLHVHKMKTNDKIGYFIDVANAWHKHINLRCNFWCIVITLQYKIGGLTVWEGQTSHGERLMNTNKHRMCTYDDMRYGSYTHNAVLPAITLQCKKCTQETYRAPTGKHITQFTWVLHIIFLEKKTDRNAAIVNHRNVDFSYVIMTDRGNTSKVCKCDKSVFVSCPKKADIYENQFTCFP